MSKTSTKNPAMQSPKLNLCMYVKEVLWISVGQLAANLQAVKVGGKKESAVGPGLNPLRPHQGKQQNFSFDLKL